MTDEEEKLVQEAASKLAEHFDSVRIFVTKHCGESESTNDYDTGVGNFHAQLGQISGWLDIQREHARAYARRKDSEE